MILHNRQTFLLSLAFGVFIAFIPFILKLRRDPFDAGESYAIWWIGFFAVSAIIGFRTPREAKKVALGVGFGLPLALIGYFVMSPNSANLWPLSLILGTVIALPPAFVGAYLGRFLRGSNNLPE